MAKLKLVANPTFKAKVPVPVAGGPAVDVEMTFRHRRRSEVTEWSKPQEGRTDTQMFMEMVVDWELEDPFTEESVSEFLDKFGGAATATFTTYLLELTGARVKN